LHSNNQVTPNNNIIKKVACIITWLLFLQFTSKTSVAQIDTDFDGMDDAWETANGLNPTDATDAWCDCDNDQILNLFEYQLQTDPSDVNSPPILYFNTQNTQEEFTELMNSGINGLAVIRMSAGTYNLSYDTNSSGGLITSSDYRIMIQGGWNNDFTVYDPFQYSTIFDGQGSQNILVLETQENQETTFILDGAEVTNSGNNEKEAAIKCIDRAGTSKFSFYNCSFYNNGYGTTDSGFALSIDWLDEMINGDFFLVNTSIVNNRNGLWGQLSPTTSGRWRIYNSTITNSTQTTIFEVEATSQTPNAIAIDVLNSIIWESDLDDPIFFHAAQNTGMNIAYSNISEINNIDNLLEVNSLTTSVTNILPEFINENINHFELQTQSPLKEAGLDIGLPFEGIAPDIGVNQKVYSPIRIDTLITQPTCLGNDGRIEIVPLDEVGGLTFSLDNVDFQTDFIFNNLEMGNHTLYVRREEACQKMQLPFILEEVEQQFRTETATFCNNESYTLPDGTIVTGAGVYNTTVSNSQNCSIYIETILTELPSYETTNEASICAGETYTLVDGREANTSGRYVKTIQSVEGCDSTVIINLTINEAITTQNSITFCQAVVGSYTLEDGTVVSESGTYTAELFNNVTSCIDTYITEVIFTDFFETTQDVSICEGQTYTLPDGMGVTAANTYETTLQSTLGCDSIVITNLTYITSTEFINEQITICSGESYTLPDGRIVAEQATYVSEINQDGCDYRYVTTLRVSLVEDVIEYPIICRGETLELPDGRLVTEAGTYESSFISVYGCDSLVYKVLSVTMPMEEKEVSICEGETYTLEDGRTVSEAGTYTFESASSTGCITTHNTTLIINDVFETTQNASFCEGQIYVLPDGRPVSNADIYESALLSVNGCDSTVITNLTVNSTLPVEQEIGICIGATYTLANGMVVSEADTYSFDLVDGVTGCIIAYTTTITIDNAFETTQEASICESETYLLPDGREVSVQDTYESTLQSTFGCDSIVFTNLTVISNEEINEEITICEGGNHTLPDGTMVIEPDTYVTNIINPDGCTQRYITILNVNEIDLINNQVFICRGVSYELPDGRIVTEEGTYENKFTSIYGCDSIINIILGVNTQIIEKEESICSGATYTLEDGMIVSEAGTYSVEMADETTGCITTFNTILNVNEVFQITENKIVCDAETYVLPDGIEVNASGIYESAFQSVEGCDSIITTNLSINSSQIIREEGSICQGEIYILADGTEISEAGTFPFELEDVSTGCTAMYETTITINNTFESLENIEICEGQTHALPDGIEVNIPGTYESKLQTTLGCDSTIITNLTVIPPLVIEKEASICGGTTYTLEDQTIVSESGIYFANLMDDVTGCITTYQTTITVGDAIGTTESVAICEGETYRLPDGREINVAGMYDNILQSVQGCDSIVKIDLSTSSINVSLPVELTFITGGVELFSNIQSSNAVEYLWSPAEGLSCTDCAWPLANPNETTTYLLEVTDVLSGCKDEATIDVVKLKGAPLVPNAFSPNSDRINDFLIPLNLEPGTDFLFVIYNRLGEKIFETQSIAQPWDGFYNNEKQSIGVYIWYLQYEDPDNGDIEQIKGNVTLVR